MTFQDLKRYTTNANKLLNCFFVNRLYILIVWVKLAVISDVYIVNKDIFDPNLHGVNPI